MLGGERGRNMETGRSSEPASSPASSGSLEPSCVPSIPRCWSWRRPLGDLWADAAICWLYPHVASVRLFTVLGRKLGFSQLNPQTPLLEGKKTQRTNQLAASRAQDDFQTTLGPSSPTHISAAALCKPARAQSFLSGL